jgi:putative Ca2+/H+ antiporter (TMEM165/GDT1 family)
LDWRLLVTTLGLVFVAELGDKTQLAVITMTARTGKPITVLVGAVVALALVTVLGVLLGGVITRFVPIEWVSKGASMAFITIGALMLLGKL